MALNIAVPLSGVGDLSPISPIRTDCWENIKMLVSPIGSESSGVSSLDSEEAKQQLKPTPSRKPEAIKQELRIYYNGRNILDLYTNLETNSAAWKFQYSHLPERNNISMFWANRSLYNRLGPNGLTPVYTINKCECCDFQYTSDCPNSYLSKTSLNVSSTTTSPMIFTTASNKKQEYQTTKVTDASKLSTNATPVFKEQSFLGYKNNLEEFRSQNHVNKLKINDIFLKKPNILTNKNSNYNSINKINNLLDTTKATSDISLITSALVGAKSNNTSSNTPPPNMVMSYNNTMQQCNEKMANINSKSNTPQNIFNSSLLLTNPTNASYNFHVNTSNNILPNQTSICNKSQITSSNNFYSLFNSSNTNNSVIYAFNTNGNSNVNTYINSYNTMSNSSNNINSNPFTVSSQHYGRMYKYF